MVSTKTLFWKLVVMSLAYYFMTMLLLFIPAGTIHYQDGWNYLILIGSISTILTFYFFIKDPHLIEVRMKTEKEEKQKKIRAILILLFFLSYIMAGLDFRFQWSDVPGYLKWISIVIFILGYAIVFFVFKENSFTASNIKAYEGQKVIDTGLYSLIRHPMYSGSFLIVLTTPVILGSFWTLLPSALICIVIVVRAIDEERVLGRDLEGYEEYMRRVRYRFIPTII